MADLIPVVGGVLTALFLMACTWFGLHERGHRR